LIEWEKRNENEKTVRNLFQKMRNPFNSLETSFAILDMDRQEKTGWISRYFT